jgi:predicted amidohydrolase
VGRKFKAATLQFEVDPTSIQHNLSIAEELLEEAASEGAELAVFPEYCWTAYANPQRAEQVPYGPTLTRLGELARKHLMCIASGSLVEKDQDGMYLTSVLLGRDGALLGKHRKTSLVGADLEVKLEGKSVVGMKDEIGAGICAGSKLDPIRTELGNLGILLGAELDVPEAARTLIMKGAEILLASVSFETRWVEDINFLGRARAYENSAYVIVANRSGLWDSPEGYLTYGGGSAIVSPLGEIICTIGQRATKGISVATIDLDQLGEVRRSFNILNLRRPHAYISANTT